MNRRTRLHLHDALHALGLTPLEADVYSLLLSAGPASGYRIAQELGKPAGSIYKTLEVLRDKGAAVLAQSSGTAIARAIPIDHLAAARRIALDQAAQTVAALAAPRSPNSAHELLHALVDLPQALARAQAMLAAATDFIIITATPAAARLIREPARAAAARAVHVGLKAYAPIDIPGATVVLDPRGPSILNSAPGERLVITADGREYLFALLDDDASELLSGVWTDHAMLNWSLYTGQSSDFILAATRSALASGATPDHLASLYQSLAPFETPRSDAKRELAARFQSPLASPPRATPARRRGRPPAHPFPRPSAD